MIFFLRAQFVLWAERSDHLLTINVPLKKNMITSIKEKEDVCFSIEKCTFVLEGLRGVILQKERIEIEMIIDNTNYLQNLFYRMIFVPFS